MSLKIKNLLITIKNGYRKKSKFIKVSNSKLNIAVLNELIYGGFIRGFEVVDNNILNIFLKYSPDMSPAISSYKPLMSLQQKFPAGSFNQSLLLRDFNSLFINCPSKGFLFFRGKLSHCHAVLLVR